MDTSARKGRYGEDVAPAASPPRQQVKRLTLDLPMDVHRTLKLRSVELDMPMAELLRELIAEALADPSALGQLAERRRRGAA